MSVAIGAADLAGMLRPKERGERINAHILPVVKEPTPDYEAMRRLVTTPGAMPIPPHGERNDTAAPLRREDD